MGIDTYDFSLQYNTDISFAIWYIKPIQCWGYFHPKHQDTKIFEKHLNPVMLVFIG